MLVTGVVPTSVHSVKWQDYRGSETGMIVFYNTDPVSEIPLRELPEELPSEIVLDPNYETGTYGLYGCKHTKTRSSFSKKKIRYLFFMTRYAGTNIDFMDELVITGFYRIKQTADVQKLHIRYLNEYSCINEDSCLALRADKVHFVAVTDAFMITPEVLESWGSKSRVTRQTKIMLDEEKTAELLAYLESKRNIIDLYSSETERLQPAIDEDEDEEEVDDEELFEDAGEYEEYIDDLEEEKEEASQAPEVAVSVETDQAGVAQGDRDAGERRPHLGGRRGDRAQRQPDLQRADQLDPVGSPATRRHPSRGRVRHRSRIRDRGHAANRARPPRRARRA